MAKIVTVIQLPSFSWTATFLRVILTLLLRLLRLMEEERGKWAVNCALYSGQKCLRQPLVLFVTTLLLHACNIGTEQGCRFFSLILKEFSLESRLRVLVFSNP